jgi:hypothetical protein
MLVPNPAQPCGSGQVPVERTTMNSWDDENAMRRVEQSGAKPVTALSVLLEWQRDWALRDTCDAVMDIVRSHRRRKSEYPPYRPEHRS